MLRLVLLAAIALLATGSLTSASAQTDALPAVGADGMTAPLTVDQLTAEERATYASLLTGSDDARQFLYTRGFLRFCERVIAGQLPPLQLPPLPVRANWDRQFLSAHEATDVVDRALGMKLALRVPPAQEAPPIDPILFRQYNLPAIDAEGRALPLSPEQLSVEERPRFAAVSGDDAVRFLTVRGYLRFAELVVNGTIAPAQLPRLPPRAQWDRQWLSEDEARDVLDVALAMKISARMAQPPPQ